MIYQSTHILLQVVSINECLALIHHPQNPLYKTPYKKQQDHNT